jgi:hypothetical protein
MKKPLRPGMVAEVVATGARSDTSIVTRAPMLGAEPEATRQAKRPLAALA